MRPSFIPFFGLLVFSRNGYDKATDLEIQGSRIREYRALFRVSGFRGLEFQVHGSVQGLGSVWIGATLGFGASKGALQPHKKMWIEGGGVNCELAVDSHRTCVLLIENVIQPQFSSRFLVNILFKRNLWSLLGSTPLRSLFLFFLLVFLHLRVPKNADRPQGHHRVSHSFCFTFFHGS